MSKMTNQMAEASVTPAQKGGGHAPQKGERYRCAKCGMEVEVTAPCNCQGPCAAHFHCCGQELQRA